MGANCYQPSSYSAMKGIFPLDFTDCAKIGLLIEVESHLLDCFEKHLQRLKRS